MKRAIIDIYQIGIILLDDYKGPDPEGLIISLDGFKKEFLNKIHFILTECIDIPDGKDVIFSIHTHTIIRIGKPDYFYGQLSFRESEEGGHADMLDIESLQNEEKKDVLLMKTPYNPKGLLSNQVEQMKNTISN